MASAASLGLASDLRFWSLLDAAVLARPPPRPPTGPRPHAPAWGEGPAGALAGTDVRGPSRPVPRLFDAVVRLVVRYTNAKVKPAWFGARPMGIPPWLWFRS